MEKKCKSGASKRKIKRAAENARAKLPKLTSFLVHADSHKEQPPTSPISTTVEIEIVQAVQTEELNKNIYEQKPIENHSEGVNISEDKIPIEEIEVDQQASETELLTNNSIIQNFLNQNFPTDIAHYPQNLTTEMKKFILKYEPCKPKEPFPKNLKNRSFSEVYYSTFSKSGIKINRQWLCYSATLDVVYCEPCWLFSTTKNNWTKGINDWQNLSNKIKDHENGYRHVQACMAKEVWKKNTLIDDSIRESIEEQYNFWRKVLERLFKIILKLSRNSLALRGHREDINGFRFTSQKHQILSPTIQNEIVGCLAQHLRKQLSSQIKEAPYFSIIADTTQDISKIDQLSLICRYVHIAKNSDDNIPIRLNIKETFLGFTKLTDGSAAGITSVIFDCINAYDLEIKKCRGQGYDGANTMSGAYSGV
ncbi:hypothetical protein FQR65_LT14445 [Abscondita terminalis]|nr:hypothetical protein FQR65_LT14445 [Abscondita terminalis]